MTGLNPREKSVTYLRMSLTTLKCSSFPNPERAVLYATLIIIPKYIFQMTPEVNKAKLLKQDLSWQKKKIQNSLSGLFFRLFPKG